MYAEGTHSVHQTGRQQLTIPDVTAADFDLLTMSSMLFVMSAGPCGCFGLRSPPPLLLLLPAQHSTLCLRCWCCCCGRLFLLLNPPACCNDAAQPCCCRQRTSAAAGRGILCTGCCCNWGVSRGRLPCRRDPRLLHCAAAWTCICLLLLVLLWGEKQEGGRQAGVVMVA